MTWHEGFAWGLISATALIVAAPVVFPALLRAAQRASDAQRITQLEPQQPRTAPPPRSYSGSISPEDACLHCRGSKKCQQCGPHCAACQGTGIRPRDRKLLECLDRLWKAS